MGIARKLMIRFLGTRSQRIYSEFADVIVRTTKEFEKADQSIADDSIKNLLIIWFVSLPWTYFETLFINKESWNVPLLALLDNAHVINGEDCALVSQAFCLWFLEQLLRNDENYKSYSMKEIEQWIRDQVTKGIFLTEKLKKFRKVLRDLPPDDWYFEYINEILSVLYTDHEKRSSIITSMRLDSQLRLALSIYSTEMIVTSKQAQSEKL